MSTPEDSSSMPPYQAFAHHPSQPVPAAQMRIGDVERTTVSEILHSAFADGRLTEDELDSRLSVALAAKTQADLLPITADLVSDQPFRQGPSQPSLPPAFASAPPESALIMAFMSGTTRTNSWRVPSQATVVAVMGGVDLDFTHAQWTGPEANFTVFAWMGGIDIYVPDDVEVVNKAVGIMGDVTIRGGGGPNSPKRLIISGAALMGGIEVKGPKSG